MAWIHGQIKNWQALVDYYRRTDNTEMMEKAIRTRDGYARLLTMR